MDVRYKREPSQLFRAVAVHAVARGHGAVQSGDAGAMWIAVGVAELGGDPGFEALGDEVFQALGLVVQLIDFVVEHAIQEGLDETVVTDDLQGAAASRWRETDA